MYEVQAWDCFESQFVVPPISIENLLGFTIFHQQNNYHYVFSCVELYKLG